MRLLVVAPFLPDPRASHGGGSYLGALCEGLSRHAELGLVAPLLPNEQDRLQELGSSVFARVFPANAPSRPSGLRRHLHRAQMLLRWGLLRQPLVAAKFGTAAMHAAVRRAVAEFAPDVVLLELAQSAQFMANAAGVPCVITDHEAGVPANTRTDLGAWADRRDQGLWRNYVQRHYAEADLVQALTEEDAAELRRTLSREVLVRAPAVSVPSQPIRRTGTPQRMLFLGSYSHEPNERAAAVLADEVLPLVRRRAPGAELWFAGPDCNRIANLARAGVRIVGFRDDLASLFAEVRLVLSPLYSGGGFRMKVLSALAHGVPVVTNALGARGAAAPAPAKLVAETHEGLAEAAASLLLDEARCIEAGALAHRWASENLSPDAVAATQLQRIRELIAARGARR